MMRAGWVWASLFVALSAPAPPPRRRCAWWTCLRCKTLDTWTNAGANPFRVGVSVVDGAPATRPKPNYASRIDLPGNIGPREEATLTFNIPAFTAPGSRTVELDMVHELKTWFEARGDIPLETTFEVLALAPGQSGPSGPDGGGSDEDRAAPGRRTQSTRMPPPRGAAAKMRGLRDLTSRSWPPECSDEPYFSVAAD